MTTTQTSSIVQEIIAVEWRMFQRVKSATPVSCQRNPDAFGKIRTSVFQLWPQEMLSAYLKELKAAEKSGRNLLTEKYARMDRLIDPLTTHPCIDKIIAIEEKWQAELKSTYPALYQKTCRGTDPVDNGSNFSVYLRCELETYGDAVIEMYHDWVTDAAKRGENLSVTMLHELVTKGGFTSLDQAEKYFFERTQPRHRKRG